MEFHLKINRCCWGYSLGLFLLFQRPVQAQHASVAALAEQQKQEIERQRSEAGAAGAF